MSQPNHVEKQRSNDVKSNKMMLELMVLFLLIFPWNRLGYEFLNESRWSSTLRTFVTAMWVFA